MNNDYEFFEFVFLVIFCLQLLFFSMVFLIFNFNDFFH